MYSINSGHDGHRLGGYVGEAHAHGWTLFLVVGVDHQESEIKQKESGDYLEKSFL